MFELHPDLIRDCVYVCDLPLCRVLLRNDARFPWVILVPRKQGLCEWFDLQDADASQCQQEVMQVASAMKAEFCADKMNIAALGNITPQLHIHLIARFHNDAAWPQPIWGRAPQYSTARKSKPRC